MKRKGLTIIFFSVTVLAATPRAMEHFKSYVSAVRSEAQAHMLNYLLNYGAPAEETNAAPATAQESLACTETSEPTNVPESVVASTKTSVKSSIVRPGRFSRSQHNLGPATLSNAFSWSFEHVDVGDINSKQFDYALDHRADLLAPSVAKVAKLDAAKSLLRAKMDNKKAARVLERELYALFSSRTRTTPRRVPLMRVRMDSDTPAPTAVEPPSPPACDVSNQQLTAGEY